MRPIRNMLPNLGGIDISPMIVLLIILFIRMVVMDNLIQDAPVGVLKETGSAGNIIGANRFFNTPVLVQDPQLVDVTKLISPKR